MADVAVKPRAGLLSLMPLPLAEAALEAAPLVRLLSESRLFFQGEPPLVALCRRRLLRAEAAECFLDTGESVTVDADSGLLPFRDGVLLEPWIGDRPMLVFTSSRMRPADAAAWNLGFGGGFGAGELETSCLLLLSCIFSLLTSSDVNWIVVVLPPRNFSQPGASARST